MAAHQAEKALLELLALCLACQKNAANCKGRENVFSEQLQTPWGYAPIPSPKPRIACLNNRLVGL